MTNNNYRDLVPWLYNSGPGWRLMALRWLGPQCPTTDDIALAYDSSPIREVFGDGVQPADWGGKRRFYNNRFSGLTWRLQLLADMGGDRSIPKVTDAVDMLLEWGTTSIGGLSYRPGQAPFPCVTGSIINTLVKLGYTDDERVIALGEWLAKEVRFDGGWICPVRSRDFLHKHSHSCFTASYSAVEGLLALSSQSREIAKSKDDGIEFLLKHRLFRSDRTGQVLCSRWLETGYPSYSYYSVTKGALLVASAGKADDPRAQEAFQHIENHRLPDGTWLQGWIPAKPMPYRGEEPGTPDRALTILNWAALARAGRTDYPKL